MIDRKNNVKYVTAVPNYNPSATGTTSGIVRDIKGFGSVTLVISNGAQTSTSITVTPVIMHGTTSTTFTSAPDTDLIGTEAAAAALLAGTAGSNATAKIGYVGKNRYVKARLILTGATTGYPGAIWALGDPSKAPQA